MVGKTGCGKTYFLQKHTFNKFFDEIVKTEWVTGIKIDDHAADPDELTELIEKFKLRTRDIVNNESNSGFLEKISMDCLIVMDDVSGIADGSHKFAEFSTFCRKCRYHCFYVFHIIAPELSLEKIFVTN